MNNTIQGKLLAPFQQAADNDSANAVAILQSGKFNYRIMSGNEEKDFTVSNGVASGTIDLVAGVGTKKDHCHNWGYSADGVTFYWMRGTTKAKTMKEGLTPGQYAYFIHELSINDVPQGESQILRIMVK